MIVWCNNDYLKIISSCKPSNSVLTLLPSDNEAERKYKIEKPFINCRNIIFNIDYLGTGFCIKIPKGYRWNGANIPKLFWRVIGSQNDPVFLNASMVHDILCENHNYIGNDRQLSSMIFREILKSSGVSNLKANIMYLAVDNFQKFCGWNCKEE